MKNLILKQCNNPDNQRKTRSIDYYSDILAAMALTIPLGLDAYSPLSFFILYRVVMPERHIEFFRFGPKAEHGFNHNKKVFSSLNVTPVILF